MNIQKIILAGATGLIGSHTVPMLIQAGFDVHIVVRKPPVLVHGATVHIAPVDQWPEIVREISAAVAISCLGTTMRVAGSKSAFAAVDLDLVTALAAAAKSSGADHFITVSSVGANAASSNFYLRTKGQVEDRICAMGFDRTDYLRPGLLRGERGGDRRFGERMGILLSPIVDTLLMGSLQRYRSIAAHDVAAAICALALRSEARTLVYENTDILALAEGRF
jgi:uncharacterized protein YbjT (DUF2867 family)